MVNSTLLILPINNSFSESLRWQKLVLYVPVEYKGLAGHKPLTIQSFWFGKSLILENLLLRYL